MTMTHRTILAGALACVFVVSTWAQTPSSAPQWSAVTQTLTTSFTRSPTARRVAMRRAFEKKDGKEAASGTLTAPFSGIHGWYWDNPGDTEVTVTLSAAGFYKMSHEFRKDVPTKTMMFP